MADIITLLKSVHPAHQSDKVPRGTLPRLVFLPAMAAGSLTADTVYLEPLGGERVLVDYEYSILARTLTLKPKEALAPLQLYQLHVKGKADGVKDVLGNTSYRDYLFNFMTEEGTLEEDPSPDEEELPTDPDPVDPTDPIEPVEPIVPVPPSAAKLYVTGSYPDKEELLLTNKPLALSFSLPLRAESLLNGRVSLIQKALSPLLSSFEEEIQVTTELSEDGYILRVTPTVPLLEGTNYSLKIKKDVLASDPFTQSLEADYTLNFLTAWGRSYTSIRSVRLLGGLFVESLSNLDLAQLIAEESDSLYRRILRLPSFREEDWVSGQAPFGAEQYVKYAVVYQVALGQTLETSSGQRQNIQLADLHIDRASSVSSSIGDILKLLKDEMDRWWKALNEMEEGDVANFVRAPMAVTRASDNFPYPDFQTRVPFNDIGGGG